MATKRRRVWVREYGQELGSIAWHARREAIRKREGVREDATGVAAFIERLPGDVVLSRKDVDTTANDVAREMLARGYTARMADEVGTIVATYLLRGRR